MQTISELNSKWWYRLLKVSYFAFLIVALFLTTSYIGNETSPYPVLDLDNSYLVCLNEDKSTDFKLSFRKVNQVENSFIAYIFLEEHWYRDDLIGRLCNSKNDYYDPQSVFNDNYVPINERSRLNWREKVLERHELIKSDKVVGSWLTTVFFIMLSWAFVIGAFEIMRRVFYYIVLGKIRPKK